MCKKVNLGLIDIDQNNAMHHAAFTSKEVIEVFGDQPDLLNKKNMLGFTPLHIACNEDSPDCVQAFLCAGADLNIAGTVDDEVPLVTAVKSSSAKAVKEILQTYPKQTRNAQICFCPNTAETHLLPVT